METENRSVLPIGSESGEGIDYKQREGDFW